MAQRSELVFTVDLCPRCGKWHNDLEFNRMVSPVATHGAAPSLDLWAMCPATAEPILGVVLATGEVEVR